MPVYGWIVIRSRKKKKKKTLTFLLQAARIVSILRLKGQIGVLCIRNASFGGFCWGNSVVWTINTTEFSSPMCRRFFRSKEERKLENRKKRERVAFPALLSGLRLKRAWGRKRHLGKTGRECAIGLIVAPWKLAYKEMTRNLFKEHQISAEQLSAERVPTETLYV